MAYIPMQVPNDPAQLPGFLLQELQQLAQSIAAPAFVLSLATSHSPPAKLRDGILVLADGVSFDPGSGPGFYGYRDGVWHFLG